MCNQGIERFPRSSSPSEMESQAPPFDETPRVKFLCSFGGSIMPRPQDSKLRYVGGETRIVSLPRDINYEELMVKMRELFEDVTVLKYQQPDEDIDALVSVVNDDDVTNMMEEYDKLGLGDGFTRLRMFLFSNPDQDYSSLSHFDSSGERDSEQRRYVDALNSLNDVSEFRKQQSPDSPVMGQVVEPSLLNPINIEFGLHNQQNCEMPMTQFNFQNLTIPNLGSGPQHQQQSHNQRYNEMEAPWSPAYYSPRQHGYQDPRLMTEFPLSPSAPRYSTAFGELSDRMPEEYVRHQSPFVDNVGWVRAGAQNGFEGNTNCVCEHCRMTFQRNQTASEAVRYPDSRFHHGVQPHLDQSNAGNPCAECSRNRETYIFNPDANLEHGVYSKDQNEPPPSYYTEAHNHERGWVLHHQLNHRVEDPRLHMSGAGRMNEHYRVDGFEDHGVHYGNFPAPYGTDNLYQTSHGHTPAPHLWIKVQNPLHATPSYEALNLLPQANNTINPGFLREGSPSFHVGLDNPNPGVGPSQIASGFDGSAAPECVHGCAPKLDSDTLVQDNQHTFVHFSIPKESVPHVPSSSSVIDDKVLGSSISVFNAGATNGIEGTGEVRLETKNMFGEGFQAKCIETVEDPKKSKEDGLRPTKEGGDTVKRDETIMYSAFENEGISVKRLSFLPELIASVKKAAALECVEEMKARVEDNVDGNGDMDTTSKEAALHDVESDNAHADVEVDSDSDNPQITKIEPTKAEAEALSRGLQTIQNDDLEQIRELGSGTYGAVYHGKWKGSDVAIKRIKASCFAARPSERERLIADFWKEALILSSLHHPNVVSFYGIVRDGPDGSLATVTEFMVNGSLKQFLQKKDRTIDRRKRLIIAMDAAFGMEYLHGKNIVHFDLKCENLLVNMRDPHRPVCKIGDLGLSKVKQQTLVSGGVRGTLPWMAPELLSGKSNMVTEKIDVYSFGIVMWELLSGEEPYADMRCSSIIGGIVNNSLRPQVPSWCDPEWKSLMQSCWASDPGERPSFSEISQKLRKMSAAINLK